MTATQRMPARVREIFTNDELSAEFAWISWLTPRYQRRCIGEIHTALEAHASERELIELLGGWRATAEIESSPAMKDEIARNLNSGTFASIDEWLNTRHTA